MMKASIFSIIIISLLLVGCEPYERLYGQEKPEIPREIKPDYVDCSNNIICYYAGSLSCVKVDYISEGC